VTTLVLASRSPARAALLAGAGVRFETDSADVDEAAVKAVLIASGAGPRAIAERLAAEKALAVSRRRAGLVIGADQTLDLAGVLFDKARDLADARAKLALLRGRAHQLHAAIAVAQDGAVVWRDLASATLAMRGFTDAFLEGYLQRGGERLLGSVGCYALEGEGVQLFERIDGDYFTILGLPLLNLLAFLRDRGVAQR
jgi:septum formation protein